MAITSIKDLLTEYLSEIGYVKPSEKRAFSPQNTLKNTLMSGHGVEIYRLSENKFRAELKPESFYEAVATDFYYSYQKVCKQRAVIDSMISNNCHNAWLLVTAYYHAFYGAIELSRLKGIYNTSFQKEDIDYFNIVFKNGGTITKVGTYKGEVHQFDHANNQIVINFQQNGTKPHKVTWQNLNSLLSSISQLEKTDSNYKKLERLRNIISEESQYPLPSELRNKWNYSKVDAYSESSHSVLAEMGSMLDARNFKRCFGWAEMKLKQVDEKAYACSLAYTCSVIEKTLESLTPKILN